MKETNHKYLDFEECSVCKKEFIPSPLHLYKLVKPGKTIKQCSYTCYRIAGGDNGKRRTTPRTPKR